MLNLAKRFALAGLFILLAFTAHAELPALIPREILFGNAERSHPELSPEGDQLAWLAPDKGVVNVWVSSLAGANPHAVTAIRDTSSIFKTTAGTRSVTCFRLT